MAIVDDDDERHVEGMGSEHVTGHGGSNVGAANMQAEYSDDRDVDNYNYNNGKGKGKGKGKVRKDGSFDNGFEDTVVAIGAHEAEVINEMMDDQNAIKKYGKQHGIDNNNMKNSNSQVLTPTGDDNYNGAVNFNSEYISGDYMSRNATLSNYSDASSVLNGMRRATEDGDIVTIGGGNDDADDADHGVNNDDSNKRPSANKQSNDNSGMMAIDGFETIGAHEESIKDNLNQNVDVDHDDNDDASLGNVETLGAEIV